MESERAVLIRYERTGKPRRGSGLRVGGRFVLTADHCADGTSHRVVVDGTEYLATVHQRSGTSDVDLAVLSAGTLPELPAVGCALVNRDEALQLNACQALGFPSWKGTPDTPELAQSRGNVPTAEGRRPAGGGLGVELLAFKITDPEAEGHPVPEGALDTPTSVWAGMSGAVVVNADDLIVGVVCSHAFAEGGRSLTITPLEAIDRLTAPVADILWAALGVTDSSLLPRLPTGDEGLAWPLRVGLVPDVAHMYQDRGIDLTAPVLDAPSTAATLVLAGLGGAGKTQLAAAYARHRWQERQLDLLVWVTAQSREAILSGLAATARTAGLQVDGSDIERGAAAALAWLDRTRSRWLIVLDDLDDPGDLASLWPTGPTGTVVVTTRRTDTSLRRDDRTVIDIDVFTPAQATAYLARKLTLPPDDAEIAGLAQDLGCLPLALAQAAAYIADRGPLTVSVYRRRFTDRKRRLLDLLPEDADADGYALTQAKKTQATVAATWSLSIDAANALTPVDVAGRLLQATSVLDPNGIPTVVLHSGAVLNYLNRPLGTPIATGPDQISTNVFGTDDVDDALAHLRRFSLAATAQPSAGPTRTGGPAWVRVHALVQRAVYDQLEPDLHGPLVQAVADALNETWPAEDYRPENLEITTAFRANTDALVARAGDLLWHPDGHPVLWTEGRSLEGLPHQAVHHWRRVAGNAERVLGPTHPNTLSSGGNLARAFQAVGRTSEAIPLHEQNLRVRIELFGSTHPDTLTSRNNLAGAYQAAGRTTEAIALYESTLHDSEQTVGPTHPSALTIRNNLASTYRGAGRATEAIPLFESIVHDSEQILGPDHPNTLASRNNLASTYQAAGRTAEAILLHETTLHAREQALGPTHPETLSSRNNLAYAYQAAGRTTEGIALYQATLRDCERTLGPDHPNTLLIRNNLAHAYQAAGRDQILSSPDLPESPPHPGS